MSFHAGTRPGVEPVERVIRASGTTEVEVRGAEGTAFLVVGFGGPLNLVTLEAERSRDGATWEFTPVVDLLLRDLGAFLPFVVEPDQLVQPWVVATVEARGFRLARLNATITPHPDHPDFTVRIVGLPTLR